MQGAGGWAVLEGGGGGAARWMCKAGGGPCPGAIHMEHDALSSHPWQPCSCAGLTTAGLTTAAPTPPTQACCMPCPAGLPDVERLVRKLDSRKGSMGLGELCQLYRVSARLPLIEDALRQHEGTHAQLLADRWAPGCRCAGHPHSAVGGAAGVGEDGPQGRRRGWVRQDVKVHISVCPEWRSTHAGSCWRVGTGYNWCVRFYAFWCGLTPTPLCCPAPQVLHHPV